MCDGCLIERRPNGLAGDRLSSGLAKITTNWMAEAAADGMRHWENRGKVAASEVARSTTISLFSREDVAEHKNNTFNHVGTDQEGSVEV